MAERDLSTLDPHAVCLRDAATRMGIATDALLLDRGGGRTAMHLALYLESSTWQFRAGVLRAAPAAAATRGPHINGAAVSVTTDKMATKNALDRAGLAVPRGRLFGRDGVYGAIAFAAGLGGPVCVKPNRGRKGILVHPGRRTPDAIAAAFEAVARRYDEILVEESVSGEVVRYFYVRPRAVAVKISRPANVVGDGIRTIADLIHLKNAERARRALPGHHPIVIDAALAAALAVHGLSLESVPPAGRRVLLLPISNGAAGADSIECADTTDPSYARAVEAAGAAIPGLRISAIDMIVRDRRVPANPRNHWFLELNSSPGLLPYHYPWEGRPQDVAGAILQHLRDGP